MSVRPTEYLDWNPSLSNVIDPPGTQKTSGWLVGQEPPAQFFNWIINLTDQWVQYLDPIITVTAGEDLAANTPVYVSDGTDSRTAGRAYKCDASSALGLVRHRFIGFTVGLISTGVSGAVITGGKLDGFSSLTAGKIYWVDPTTPGDITSTQPDSGTFPGAYLVPVGMAISSTEIIVNSSLGSTSNQIPTPMGAGLGTGGVVSLDPSVDSPYTMTVGQTGIVFWVKSSLGAMQMNLPTPTSGLIFTVIDVDGSFNTNNATWHRNGSEKINGLASDYVMEAPYGRWTIESDGTDWFFAATG